MGGDGDGGRGLPRPLLPASMWTLSCSLDARNGSARFKFLKEEVILHVARDSVCLWEETRLESILLLHPLELEAPKSLN